tara:strand:- start:119 stop:655 length:537 start_codon:yes stop_codon:yes gene_type:complete
MTTAAIPKGDTPMPAVETVPGADDRQVVETRFGPMEFTKDQALFMPRGVLGFAEHKNFGLAYLPNKFIDQLMLLQSLNDAGTSFLVLPVGIDSGIIEPRDLHGACNTMEIEPEDAVIALIVTVRDAGGQPQVTVNLRAPIVLDTNSRTGWQYVLPNSKYSVRHLLNLDAVAETPSAER